LGSQARNSTALGRRNIHRFLLQIQIAPNFGTAGQRVCTHDLLDGSAFLQSETPRNIILFMALGRMLALTLQSPVLPLPYNPKLDGAFTASIEWAMIKSGAAFAIPRTVILRQKKHSEIVKIIKLMQLKSGQLTVFCRKWLMAFAFCLGVTGLLASSIDFATIRATSVLISSSVICCEDQEATFSHLA
jgi:hypothetical protein